MFNFKEIFPRLIRHFKTGGIHSSNDNALEKFAVLKDMDHIWSNVRSLNFRTANLQLFKEIVNKIPGRWPSGTREQKRGGRSLRKSSM